MSTNILITGANGQLGSELQLIANSHPEYKFYFTNKNELDITNKQTIVEYCKLEDIEIIINCAAYTAVDNAEIHQDAANLINHLSVKHLAEYAKKNNVALIHISTDYVFNGHNYLPYQESDPVNPKSVYGKTKCDGEKALLDVNPPNSIILRTSWVYSSFGHNFVKTMLRLGAEKSEIGVIFDQIGSPTYARDLARLILDIIPQIKNNHVELYHYSNEGVSSWYDFAKAIFQIKNIPCIVNPIETKAYPTPATRPHFSLLNKNKIKQRYGIKIPYWKDSLAECLAHIQTTQESNNAK